MVVYLHYPYVFIPMYSNHQLILYVNIGLDSYAPVVLGEGVFLFIIIVLLFDVL